MKILRKGDDFKKMPEKSVHEVLVIKNLVENGGWSYCPKEVYKNFYKVEEKETKPEIEKKTRKSDKKLKK